MDREDEEVPLYHQAEVKACTRCGASPLPPEASAQDSSDPLANPCLLLPILGPPSAGPQHSRVPFLFEISSA